MIHTAVSHSVAHSHSIVTMFLHKPVQIALSECIVKLLSPLGNGGSGFPMWCTGNLCKELWYSKWQRLPHTHIHTQKKKKDCYTMPNVCKYSLISDIVLRY